MMPNLKERLVELVMRTPCVVMSSRFAAEHIADNLIANGVTVNGWISVEDRLPEENTEVLIYCKTKRGKEVFFLVDKIRYFSGLPIGQVWSGEVTHGMPLHELPKEV